MPRVHSNSMAFIAISVHCVFIEHFDAAMSHRHHRERRVLLHPHPDAAQIDKIQAVTSSRCSGVQCCCASSSILQALPARRQRRGKGKVKLEPKVDSGQESQTAATLAAGKPPQKSVSDETGPAKDTQAAPAKAVELALTDAVEVDADTSTADVGGDEDESMIAGGIAQPAGVKV